METTINQRFEMLRTHLNLKQQDFASLIGITTGQLSRIENGKNEPQNGTLNKVLETISVSREYLFEGKGELKAHVINKSSSANDPWKDEAYSVLKNENSRMAKELDRLWQMVQHLSGGAKPNFLKASENAYSFKMFPGMEQLNTVSGAIVS